MKHSPSQFEESLEQLLQAVPIPERTDRTAALRHATIQAYRTHQIYSMHTSTYRRQWLRLLIPASALAVGALVFVLAGGPLAIQQAGQKFARTNSPIANITNQSVESVVADSITNTFGTSAQAIRHMKIRYTSGSEKWDANQTIETWSQPLVGTITILTQPIAGEPYAGIESTMNHVVNAQTTESCFFDNAQVTDIATACRRTDVQAAAHTPALTGEKIAATQPTIVEHEGYDGPVKTLSITTPTPLPTEPEALSHGESEVVGTVQPRLRVWTNTYNTLTEQPTSRDNTHWVASSFGPSLHPEDVVENKKTASGYENQFAVIGNLGQKRAIETLPNEPENIARETQFLVQLSYEKIVALGEGNLPEPTFETVMRSDVYHYDLETNALTTLTADEVQAVNDQLILDYQADALQRADNNWETNRQKWLLSPEKYVKEFRNYGVVESQSTDGALMTVVYRATDVSDEMRTTVVIDTTKKQVVKTSTAVNGEIIDTMEVQISEQIEQPDPNFFTQQHWKTLTTVAFAAAKQAGRELEMK